ncbi:MAG TPA: FHA domain-containing serine/threonine-protein kinase [Aggregatilineales bacterium]|nr:FHA domain-containing serine/threonine-protein kinase [Aggregatilineales bacterium]
MSTDQPQRIDHYDILEVLGTGGMSTVYKALDSQLERPVALKLMHSHLASKPDFQSRFLAEARAIAVLDHPHIIKVFEVAFREGRLFLVMEYIEGGTLRQRLNEHLRERKFLDLREIVSITRQVAQALHYAHEHGIIHRDVKPDNVLLKAVENPATQISGTGAVLTDFGLAKRVDVVGPITASGELLGTLTYMAPEQFRGGVIDQRCDVYSLGVMLYELVAGMPPFGSTSAFDMILMHTQGEPERLQDLRPDTPPSLVSIIHRCMLKDPDDRFETAGEIARELEALEKSIRQLSVAGISRGTLSPNAVVSNGPATIFDVLPALDRPAIPVDLFSEGADDIIIVTPFEGLSWRMPFEKPSLTVGRDAACDLQLDDPRVSRQHVRIDRLPDGQIIVADLGSLNGMYIGDDKIEKSMMAEWPSSQSVKVGPFWLTLRLAKSPAGIGRRLALHAPRAVEGRITGENALVRLSPSEAIVEPGSAAIVRVEISNNSNVDKYYILNVKGVEPEWFTMAPFPIFIPANVKAERSITFHPPRAPSSAATTYDYVLIVAPRQNERQTTSLSGLLHVAPYYDFASKIETTISGFNVSITNQGNSQRHYILEIREPANTLVTLPARVRTLIGPGQTVTQPIKVVPKKRRLVGPANHRSIELFVRTDGLRPQMQTIDYAVRPRVSWETAAIFFLVLGLLLILLTRPA